MKQFRLSILAAAVMLSMAACDTPTATYVGFGSSTYSLNEGAGLASIKLYEYYTAYYYPIKVTVLATVKSGTKPDGSRVTIGEMIAFDNDPGFTVTAVDAYNLRLEGIEVGVANDTTIPFYVLDNDYLQDKTFTISFTIEKVEGSEIGTTKTTTLTIVDDEYAPRISAGYYKATYTKDAAAGRGDEAGEFTLLLTKIGKYDYIIEGLFGIDIYPPRPRLVGTFNPQLKTLTFSGSDYDNPVSEEESSLGYNSAFGEIFFYNEENRSKVLVFEGSGADGLGSIVFTTEEIAESSSGLLLKATSGCGFYIYNYDTEEKTLGTKVGAWDSFETAEFTYIGTSLNKTRSAATKHLIPFK